MVKKIHLKKKQNKKKDENAIKRNRGKNIITTITIQVVIISFFPFVENSFWCNPFIEFLTLIKFIFFNKIFHLSVFRLFCFFVI